MNKILGRQLSQSIDRDQPLKDLGFDSLMLVELRNVLQNSLKCSLPVTVWFDYSTFGEILQYLAEQVLGVQAVLENKNRREEDSDDFLYDREDISEEEAEELLIKKLEELKEGK